MQENIEKYCPNVLFNDNNISIGEFKTLEEAMTHPLKEYWCFNREEDNLFAKYKQQGCRILIICSWNRQDSQRFVIAIVGHHQVKYWDMNDVPIDKIRNDFEISIGEKAEECIYNILRQQNSTRQSQSQHPIQENNNKQINTNKNMKINETQLRKIISESVKNVLRENGEYEALISLMNKVYKCVRVNLAAEIGGNRHEVMRGGNNSILVINRDNPKDGVKISFDYIQGGLNESAFYPNYPENTIENYHMESI